MSYSPGWKPGRWSVICDVCGFRYHSDKLKKRWDGLMVCQQDMETRHPQEFLRVQPEKIVPPWVRPESSDTLTYICYLWALSGYADLAEADCARADYAALPYTFLRDLKAG